MKLDEQFIAIVKSLGCKFILRGSPITAEDAFNMSSLFPAILKKAEQLAVFCFGNGLGVTFMQTNNNPAGVSVKFDEETSNTLRLLCALDVLIEVIQNAPSSDEVVLDELMQN